MMYYLGVMQWLIKGFAWFFFKIMNISGAEAVVAAASPFIGQGESGMGEKVRGNKLCTPYGGFTAAIALAVGWLSCQAVAALCPS